MSAGGRVVLQGLVCRRDLNGMRGVVREERDAEGNLKVGVQLEGVVQEVFVSESCLRKEEEGECPICLECIGGRDDATTLPCGHGIHASCFRDFSDACVPMWGIIRETEADEEGNPIEGEARAVGVMHVISCPLCRALFPTFQIDEVRMGTAFLSVFEPIVRERIPVTLGQFTRVLETCDRNDMGSVMASFASELGIVFSVCSA